MPIPICLLILVPIVLLGLVFWYVARRFLNMKMNKGCLVWVILPIVGGACIFALMGDQESPPAAPTQGSSLSIQPTFRTVPAAPAEATSTPFITVPTEGPAATEIPPEFNDLMNFRVQVMVPALDIDAYHSLLMVDLASGGSVDIVRFCSDEVAGQYEAWDAELLALNAALEAEFSNPPETLKDVVLRTAYFIAYEGAGIQLVGQAARGCAEGGLTDQTTVLLQMATDELAQASPYKAGMEEAYNAFFNQ